MFEFKIIAKKGKARAGILKTPHGDIQTPAFIPVGTGASVKALSPANLKEIGVQIVLANTYHLNLRPGEDLVKKMGGLSEFMSWKGPTMTDSGGYQVFSLGHAQIGTKQGKFNKSVFENIRTYNPGLSTQNQSGIGSIRPARMDENGVTFYSHLDGSKLRLDSHISIGIQEKLGADLIVAFDDHESPLWSKDSIATSIEKTNRWALESLKAHKRKDQLMYGVIHGAGYKDLRIESAKFTNKHFKAIAIGGAYQTKKILYQVIDWCIPYMDEAKPRHLLGIGEVEDLINGVERGMDFFDCVAPTRRARHGSLYISPKNGGSPKNNFCMAITDKRFTQDHKPIDPSCLCYTCQNFTRSYLRHLFQTKELLAYTLASYHNIYFITVLMGNLRQSIIDGK